MKVANDLKRFIMKKQVLFSLFLLASLFGKAQAPQYYNSFVTGFNNNYPLNSGSYNRAQWIFPPHTFNAGGTGVGSAAFLGNITKVYLKLGATVSTNPYSNFTISLSQNVGTTTSFGTTTGTANSFITGMTPVFYQASGFTFTGGVASSWFGINLTSQFHYDPNLSLVVEIKVSSGAGNNISTTASTGSPLRLYGGYSGGTGTSAGGVINFGFNMIPTPLPVTLTKFEGAKKENVDVLSWSTVSELNNSHFNVQHSIDGISFNTISRVDTKAPNGTCSGNLDYETTYSQPNTGHNYYRLEQVDIDGAVSYDAKIVDLIRDIDHNTMSLYPNPTNGIANIGLTLTSASPVEIKILDINGKLIKTLQNMLPVGSSTLPIDMSQLTPATYMVQVYVNGEMQYAQKLTKN
jgi:hypothetical protein